MGAPKQKWTSEEEEALRAGVAKHGTGKWKNIQKDPEFGHCLAARSNIDLKDKWRNMSVSSGGQGSRDKQLRTPKSKSLPTPSSSTFQAKVEVTAEDASTDTAMDSSKNVPEGKPAPRYNAMIYDAISTMKDPNGSEISDINNFIEQRHEVPQNFRRLLSSKLRRLVGQGKLEKVNNCYKIKKDSIFGTRTPTPKQKDMHPKQSQSSGFVTSVDTVEEAAITAAYKIADAENKSWVASGAVKEAERVAKMAEETDSLLLLAREILEQCSRGEIVVMA